MVDAVRKRPESLSHLLDEVVRLLAGIAADPGPIKLYPYQRAASDRALERDRRTIVKALRNVRPDEHKGRYPRWRLRTIIDALEEIGARNDHRIARSSQIISEYDAVHEAYEGELERLRAESDLAKRRRFAKKIVAPMIENMTAIVRKQCKINSEEDILWQAYTDRVFNMLIAGVLQRV